MTITLPLQPQEEAKLVALARAKGLSTDALVREALDRILAEPNNDAPAEQTGLPTGADLVAAMQASPYRDVNLEPARDRLPVRDIAF
jgi:hypothetical protein